MRACIQDRVHGLRLEILEITASRNLRHTSGPEKIKHEKRILRLQEIADELRSMAHTTGAETNGNRTFLSRDTFYAT